jgi:hypothetical protein
MKTRLYIFFIVLLHSIYEEFRHKIFRIPHLAVVPSVKNRSIFIFDIIGTPLDMSMFPRFIGFHGLVRYTQNVSLNVCENVVAYSLTQCYIST